VSSAQLLGQGDCAVDLLDHDPLVIEAAQALALDQFPGQPVADPARPGDGAAPAADAQFFKLAAAHPCDHRGDDQTGGMQVAAQSAHLQGAQRHRPRDRSGPVGDDAAGGVASPWVGYADLADRIEDGRAAIVEDLRAESLRAGRAGQCRKADGQQRVAGIPSFGQAGLDLPAAGRL